MNHIRRLSALLLAAAILTGIPYLLLWHLPWPELPDSWAVAAAHLRGWRLPPGVFTAVLISALWALWGLYAAGLVVETLSRLRGVPQKLRPLGPLQVVAAAAVGTVALAPATAFADAVTQDDREADGARDGDADSAPEEEAASAEPVERVRTVSGFGVGSSDLTEEMRDDLAPVVDMIDSYGDAETPVRITGHTDPSGSVQGNQELSERRAQAVADHLDDVLGEDAPEMTVDGLGSEQPREGGAAAQRRAEVTYTVVPQPAPVQPRVMSSETETEDAGGGAAAGAEETPAAEEENDPVEAAVAAATSAAAADGGEVLVVEIPDGAVTGAVAFAGLAGGYLLGKRGVRMPSVKLSLPRLPRAPRRMALPAPPPRPTPGEDIDERVTVELDHVPGLGITGPGAAGAARRLIVNALDRLNHDSVRVLLTEADASRLVGERGRDLLRAHPCEPVRMVGTMEEALTVLQHELHEIVEEREQRPRPPLALVTAPGAEHETALSGLLLHGQHQGITAVVLGRWPLGGSCVIEEDGLITETSPPLNPVFHCSWPGASADEVMDAVRAYRHSSPALEEADEQVWRTRTAPAQTADEADAFADLFHGALGEQAGAASSETAETVESSETAATVESVKTAETAETAETVESAETIETAEFTETAARVETAEVAEAVESTQTAVSEETDRTAKAVARTRKDKEADVSEVGFWDADVWNTDFWESETRVARKADSAPSASAPSASDQADDAWAEAGPADTTQPLTRSGRFNGPSPYEETPWRDSPSEPSAPVEAVPEPTGSAHAATARTDAASPASGAERSAAEEEATSESSTFARVVAEEPVSEEPEPEETGTEEPVAEEAVTEPSSAERPVASEPAASRTAAEEPVSARRAPEEPVVEEPVVEDSVPAAETRQPSAEQYAAVLSPSKESEPAAERPAPGRPSTGTVPPSAPAPARAQRPATNERSADPQQERTPEREPAPLRKAAKRAARARLSRTTEPEPTPAKRTEQSARSERALARAQRAARPDAATSRTERLERAAKTERTSVTARAGAVAESPGQEAEGGEAEASRPLVHRPLKAGRGRTWRPREDS